MIKSRKSIGIVDTLSLEYEGNPYGHFVNVASQYEKILKQYFSVKVYASKIYLNTNNKWMCLKKLPFSTTKYEIDNPTFLTKIKSIINIIISLYVSNSYILLFQDCNQTLLYKFIKHYKGRKKLYLIKYYVEERNYVNKLLLNIKNKISGLITSIDEVGKYYGIDYIIIPDYFPENKIIPKLKNKTIDFLCIGTITRLKNYVDVINSIKNRNYSLKIIGHFPDKTYFFELQSLIYDNNNIIITDKYLSKDEYFLLIAQAKFVILPYIKDIYNFRSSGVVLESLYYGTPIICPLLKSFEFIKENMLGLVYKDSIKEVLDVDIDSYYAKIINNIKRWNEFMYQKKDLLIDFLIKGNKWE